MPHLLKKLELNGFKSFANKTVFEFPEGITAVVGPNGSGKSNVIDSIRWLLGERDAKSLRGGKSEDLIFGGTPKRPRMSQAEASLYFDNSSNFFPVDFSEVVVSRRVRGDGTNQYFINNSEVRLKDLVDFFAQARLGARGLVVITQGNSDMFIRVSPRERREMIEEMLGLREYELKKSEAERRLKHTQINLDKVQALTEEILPHLRSLKRQTARWEKRGQLEQELQDIELAFFGAAHHELHSAMVKAEERTAVKQKEFSGLDDARREAETRLQSVEASQPEEREELMEIKRKTRDILEERSKLQKEIGKLEAQLEMANTVHEQSHLPSQDDLLKLTHKIKAELRSLTFENMEHVKDRITVLLSDIDDIVESRPEPKTAPMHEGVKEEFARIYEKLSNLEELIADLGSREKELEKSQEAFYGTFKQAVAALDTAKRHVERWETEQRELHFEQERIKLRIEEWQRQVEQAGRRPADFTSLGHSEQSAHHTGSDRGDMERRMFRLRGDLASIGDIDEALVKEASETEERYAFLNSESADLVKACDDLRVLITDLRGKIKMEFDEALVKINKELQTFFEKMFAGGHAELVLAKPKPKKIEESDAEEARAELGAEVVVHDAVDLPEEEEAPEGVEIMLKLPKKRITSLEMLSGGERSLVGIAALFALISVSPPPFLVLDEVDAPLDESNARRFVDLLTQFSKETQFILVTHNRATMEAASILYGMTMNEDGTSKVVSLKLEEYSSGR